MTQFISSLSGQELLLGRTSVHRRKKSATNRAFASALPNQLINAQMWPGRPRCRGQTAEVFWSNPFGKRTKFSANDDLRT
jgi:hypothetical protein